MKKDNTTENFAIYFRITETQFSPKKNNIKHVTTLGGGGGGRACGATADGIKGLIAPAEEEVQVQEQKINNKGNNGKNGA